MTVEKLEAFPREQLIERELFRCVVSEVDLLTSLGVPTNESRPALGQGTPYSFWDLRWPCGLVLGLQFDQLTQELMGFLDAPDVDHALRHLGIAVQELALLEDEEPALFAAVCDPPDRTAELYRLDDGGTKVVVASELTRRDARCRQAEAESRGESLLIRGGEASPTPAGEPAGLPAGAATGNSVTQALVRRAAGSIGREEPTESAEPAMPSSFDPSERDDEAVTTGGLEGFGDDAFAAVSRPSPPDQR